MKVSYICNALSWTGYINSIYLLQYMLYGQSDVILLELLYDGYSIGI